MRAQTGKGKGKPGTRTGRPAPRPNGNRRPKGEDDLWGPAKPVPTMYGRPKRRPGPQTSVPAKNTGGAGRRPSVPAKNTGGAGRKKYPPAVRGAVNIRGFDYGRSTI